MVSEKSWEMGFPILGDSFRNFLAEFTLGMQIFKYKSTLLLVKICKCAPDLQGVGFMSVKLLLSIFWIIVRVSRII